MASRLLLKVVGVEVEVSFVGRKGRGKELEASGVFWRRRFVIGLIGDPGGDSASVALRFLFEGAILAPVKVVVKVVIV
jgi:hypothetical protein